MRATMMFVLSFATNMIIRSINHPVRSFTALSNNVYSVMTASNNNKPQQTRHDYKIGCIDRSRISSPRMLHFDTLPFPSIPWKIQRRQRQYQSAMILYISTTHSVIPNKRSKRRISSYHQRKSTTMRSISSNSQETTKEECIGHDKKRIVFLGTPDVAANTLQSLYLASQTSKANYEIVAVVTQPPKRRQRKGSSLEITPVAKVTQDLNITKQILYPIKLSKDEEFIHMMEHEVRPDLCITAAYGQYLSKKFLAIPKYGTVNIHPSLLPKYRGASPVQRSIAAGETIVGVTVLYTILKMDAGPIIIQKEVPLDPNDDTATNVLPMLFQLGTNLLIDYALPNIFNGTITMNQNVVQQDESAVSFAPMIDSAEAEFKVWQESATTCHNRLRGFSMWPQAFMYFVICPKDDDDPKLISDPIKVKILKTRVVYIGNNSNNNKAIMDTKVTLGPTKNDGLYVTCYDGSILELCIVQPATKKAFPARDFQNGYPNQIIRWIIPSHHQHHHEEEEKQETK